MYTWEKSNSNSKHKHSHHHNQYDPKNPTCSSSFFSKFNKSLKPHYPKSHQNEDFTPKTSTKPIKTPKNRGLSSSVTPTPTKDEKISSLRRACLVEKWMEKKGNDKVIPRGVDRNSSSSSTTLLDEFDMQDALFFSTTTTATTTTTSSSSSSSEIDYSVSNHSKQKPPRSTCFAPQMPKPIKTRTIESNFINQFGEENGDFLKDRSKAANFYSNLKNLRQPISPGVRLSSFINSLFAKDGKSKKKKCSNNNGEKHRKTEENAHSYPPYSYSTCSSASSFSRSCMNKNGINNLKKFDDDGIKRTVRFCPVSVIVDDDSQACGYKSLRDEKGEKLLMNSNFGRSLSKKYEELRKLNGLERENGDKLQQKQQQQKKLEEVALDLLSGYWDARLNKSHDLCGVNDDDYGVNHGVNYDHHEDEHDDDDDDDGFSCSSSDLFELDHLSLIENELPVYETTQLNTAKIM